MGTPTKLTRDQKQNLETRIRTLGRVRWDLGEREDTPNVISARKLAQAFDDRSQVLRDKKVKVLEDECGEAEELLYFGTPDQALTLVKKLEKKYATLK